MSGSISVSWPTAPLTEQQWRNHVEALALEAEGMVGKACGLQAQARLAVWWLGLCWPGMSPETIAASARASLLLGHNVVMATDPASQLLEVHERLDQIWAAAQSDPAAAVATVAPPLLDLPPPPAPGRPVEKASADLRDLSPAPASQPPPPDWLWSGDVAELLGISMQTVRNWRCQGRFGQPGVDWRRCGKKVFHSLESIEALESAAASISSSAA